MIRLALLAVALASTCPASLIYHINRTVDIGSVSGTISTDGTLGVLNTANIIGWDLQLNDGVSPRQIVSTFSPLVLIGGFALTANASELVFDFSAAPGAFFLLQDTSSLNYWCVETSACTTSSTARETIRVASTLLVPQSGPQVIGVTTPEPATGLLAFAALLWAGRRAATRGTSSDRDSVVPGSPASADSPVPRVSPEDC